MKLIFALIASLGLIGTAYAGDAPKKEEAKPAAAAPAKEEKKCDPKKDKDCKPEVKLPKKEEAKK